MNLKQYIIEKSKLVGIDIIGFTNCNKLNNLEDYLYNRRANNIETEFEEVDIEKRLYPRKVFPHCKSIIVVGISYNVDYKPDIRYKFKGKISKSSWGKDYHNIVKKKMNELINEIKSEIEFKYVSFVDTGPLVERELAKKAGIGWYGKNCSIINDEYGSFIFIGYILTDLEIENDEPIEEKCGNCEICLKACPTGALESAYTFNPKKCISYLTQTKNKIPYELRDKMGISVYGCDICQMVCPKNKSPIVNRHIDFIPYKTDGYVDIREILSMSNSQFKEKYGSMAGSWRGKNILKRNSIIALGNTNNIDSIQLLKEALKDSSPMIREYAAWSILKIDYEMGRSAVVNAIKIERNENVAIEMNFLINFFAEKVFYI